MRRFVFNLERVLKFRERRERLAEMQQRQALAALRQHEQAVNALRLRWQEAGAAVLENETLDVAAWLAQLRHVEMLARELAAAEARVREAGRVLEQATTRRRARALEAEALRQLRRRHHEHYLEHAGKAEQRFLDEEGLRRWRQEQNSGAKEGPS